jgi:enoyl-CoA hydratase
VVPHGGARAAAEAIAEEISRFPQECVRVDRASVLRTYGRPIREALRSEWENGQDVVAAETAAGAARFAGGKGRHGDFGDI